MGTKLSADGSLHMGNEVVVIVTTMMDITKKEHVAEPETGGAKRKTGGTVKGLGTTYFNTVIMSNPTIMDVVTEKSVP